VTGRSVEATRHEYRSAGEPLFQEFLALVAALTARGRCAAQELGEFIVIVAFAMSVSSF
jgi:hypothetical protein